MYDFILYERSLAGKKMRGADFPPSSADWSRRPGVMEMTGVRRLVCRAPRAVLYAVGTGALPQSVAGQTGI